MEKVILVNTLDEPIGEMEKMEAHFQGRLHRAFSIFIFNSKKELLLQKRADGKYHSPSLWTNTCCSHPRPGEATEDAAHRRLKYEMGFDCKLHYAFSFTYKKKLGNLTEYEFDHLFTGVFDKKPTINLLEASDWKYTSLEEIGLSIRNNPEIYTYWFKLIFKKLEKYMNHSD